jgi:hypothetical protein
MILDKEGPIVFEIRRVSTGTLKDPDNVDNPGNLFLTTPNTCRISLKASVSFLSPETVTRRPDDLSLATRTTHIDFTIESHTFSFRSKLFLSRLFPQA